MIHEFFYRVGSEGRLFAASDIGSILVISSDGLGGELNFFDNRPKSGFNFFVGQLGEKDPHGFLQGGISLADGDKGGFFA